MADYIEEIVEIQQILREDSSNFQLRRRLAILLLESGFLDEARQQILFLLGIFPGDSGLYYNLGIVYEKMKNLD